MAAILWIGSLTGAQLASISYGWQVPLPQLAAHVFTSLIISCIGYGLWTTYAYPALFSPLRGLPIAPGGFGPLGHSYAKFGSPNDTSIEKWIKTIPNDGMIRVREAFGYDAVVATSPAILKRVLVEDAYNFTKAEGIRNILRLVLGDGLIVVEGDVHKSQKQILRGSFGTGPIKDLYPIFWDKSVALLKTLESKLKTNDDLKRVSFGRWCERVTLDIIGVAAFGIEFDSLNKDANTGLAAEYAELLTVNPSRAAWFGLSFFLPQWFVSNIPFWKAPALANRMTRRLNNYAFEIAHDRRTEIKTGSSSADTSPKERTDILTGLVKNTTLEDTLLADQVLTLLTAGHETTSSALIWALVSLAENDSIQKRLRDEIRANIGSPLDSDDVPKAALLDKLPLLNAVCHETLRMFPTVPFSARTAVKETRLGDVVLPVGGQVWLPIWQFNRSPHYWGDNASEFFPDRWITDGGFNNNGGAPSNYAQMTFLHGPRVCIGQGFAKGELRCLLAALVGRYDFKLSEDKSQYPPEGLVTVKPKNGGLLDMRVVEGW